MAIKARCPKSTAHMPHPWKRGQWVRGRWVKVTYQCAGIRKLGGRKW